MILIVKIQFFIYVIWYHKSIMEENIIFICLISGEIDGDIVYLDEIKIKIKI